MSDIEIMKQLATQPLQAQRGISKFGLLMLGLIIAAFFTVGLKVGPIYVDHSLMAGLAEDLVESGQANSMTLAEVREKFGNTLRLNNINGFDLSNIRMARLDGGGTAIRIAYERRVPLIGNLDIIAVFDNTYQSASGK